MFQSFEMICGMTVLIAGTEKFYPLVIFKGDHHHLQPRYPASISYLGSIRPFSSCNILCDAAMQLHPEANVRRKLAMDQNLLQAALLHKFLNESVNFMIDLCGLLNGICASRPSRDFGVFEVKLPLRFLPLDSSILFS